MDRNIVYPGAIPLDTDQLTPQVDTMVALGWLLQSVMGTSTGIAGLACTPTSPASMVVNIGQGAIWSLEEIDTTAFGSLSADTSSLMKMGINKEGAGTNFTLTAPTTSGDSINYLIEAAFQEADGTPVVLPYYNSANPSQPYSGPNNSGTAQNTIRSQSVALQLKAGAAAPTGTQTTPAVDSGYIGLYVITVAYGALSVTSANISIYPGAPFIPATLPNVGAFVGKNRQTFTASGNFTVPNGVTVVRARGVGGGGGGGGTAGSGGGGAGGGAGGYFDGFITVTPGQIIAVTVGTGGAGGAAANSISGAGASGTTSSFGSSFSATGGAGGVAAGGTSNSPGAASGTGSGATIVESGGYGSDGIYFSGGSLGFGGCGGASFFGGGGRGSAGSVGPSNALASGSGGGGAYGSTAQVGGSGAPGIVIVEW